MLLNIGENVYGGMYDFAVSGGAIGTIDLGVPIQDKNCIVEFAMIPLVLPTGTAGATISFDTIETSVSPKVTTVAALMLATTIATIASSGVNVPIWGVFPGDAVAPLPFKLAAGNSISIGMSIAVHALTAGKIQFFVRCIQFEN